jgi:hypothetical protein
MSRGYGEGTRHSTRSLSCGLNRVNRRPRALTANSQESSVSGRALTFTSLGSQVTAISYGSGGNCEAGTFVVAALPPATPYRVTS